MVLRPILATDCTEIVQVHLAAFSGFFLSFLGPRFLKTFYLGLISDPSGIAILAENENEIVGFVAGTTEPGGFYKRLIKKSWFKFLIASFGAVVKKPSIIPKLFRAFSKPNETLPAEKCATLMSIAIAPNTQGRGYGKKLINQFIEEAKLKGCLSVNLTTDSVGNEAANRFYEGIGFELFREFTTPEGRKMNEFLYHI